MNKNMTYKKENMELRRNRVYELNNLGYNQGSIATRLGISIGCVNADLKVMHARSQHAILEYNKRLPQEVERAFSIYNSIIREAYDIISSTDDDNIKVNDIKLKGIESIRSTTDSMLHLASNFDIIKRTPELFKEQREQEEIEEGDTDKE